jgi:hypothetical protein
LGRLWWPKICIARGPRLLGAEVEGQTLLRTFSGGRELNTVGRARRRLLPSWGLSPAHSLKIYIQNGLKEASLRFINEEIVKNQQDWLF